MHLDWLSSEAVKIHAMFQNAFFAMLVAFLILAVVLEFFKIPVGDSPGFTVLVGRALMATLLVVALPETMNFMADASDSIAAQIGDLNQFKFVLGKLGEKLKELSFSWTSIRDVITILISYLSFFALYVTVNILDAAFMLCWTLIYIFSPIVFALYVFPQTSGATRGLFRSLLEVSLWKIVWAVMAALLWSTAISNINQPAAEINWLESILLNLMLMISILMTPKLVHAILSGTFGEFSNQGHGVAMAATSKTPASVMARATGALTKYPKRLGSYARGLAVNAGSKLCEKSKVYAQGTDLYKKSNDVYKNLNRRFQAPSQKSQASANKADPTQKG